MEEKDPFVDALNNEATEKESVNVENETPKQFTQYPYDRYDVNPAAESIISTLATVILVVGCIGGFIIFVMCLAMVNNLGAGMIFAGLFGGGLFALIFVLQWAILRVVVNISRNLFNINDQLKKKR